MITNGRKPLRLVHVMRRQQQVLPCFLRSKSCFHMSTLARVQTRCGFIENDKICIGDERPRDHQSALHTTGKLHDARLPRSSNCMNLSNCGTRSAMHRDSGQSTTINFEVGLNGQVWVQVVFLRHQTDSA